LKSTRVSLSNEPWTLEIDSRVVIKRAMDT
jgi:hypothetical protein